MDTVAGFLNQQNSFKVKAVSQVQLALSLIATAWEPNVTGAVAVLGILASILGNSELLQLVSVAYIAAAISSHSGYDKENCCSILFSLRFQSLLTSSKSSFTVRLGLACGK